MKHAHWFPTRAPHYAKEGTCLQACFPPGIEQLYTHQTQVLSVLQSSQAVVVATSVASGKTYALALPARIARAEVTLQHTTLLCLVSTKALARQWQRRLQAWDRTWRIETVTGDTKKREEVCLCRG
jgi:ATP-dependent helicase YprA (DUF1998 family)